MRTYLLCIKKGVIFIAEKITRNDSNKLRNFIPLGHLIKTTTWPKILECSFMKKQKQFRISEKQNTSFFYKQIG